MMTRTAVVIDSVEPLEGQEGTIVTLRGSGFAPHIRNNCVVLGGMGACARAEPDITPTELKVRIGPVARETEGDLVMWPGLGADLHTEAVTFHDTRLHFSEVAVFRNGAPVASAGIKFRLTRASPNTFAGCVERCSEARVSLWGQEAGSVLRVRLPRTLLASKATAVDVCLVLKEPTLAIDFSAEISQRGEDGEQALRAIATSVQMNASLLGEKVFADVARDRETGDLDLYVTKPYLSNGMAVLRFAA